MCEALSEKIIYSGDEYDGKGDAVGKISMLVRFRGLRIAKTPAQRNQHRYLSHGCESCRCKKHPMVTGYIVIGLVYYNRKDIFAK